MISNGVFLSSRQTRGGSNAGLDQQRELGTLPVLSGTLDWLQASGAMNERTLANIELVTRTHLLPSFSQLLQSLALRAGLRHLTALGNGVSSSPLTAAALRFVAKKVDSGLGDSLLLPEEYDEKQQKGYREAEAMATQHGRKLITLGGGYLGAQAMLDLSSHHESIRTGHVAFTQSGLNAIRDAPRKFCTETMADTPLKKLVEVDILGQWIVAQELEEWNAEKRPPPSQCTAVLLGFGKGAGIFAALVDQGFGHIVVVEPDAERQALAVATAREADTDITVAAPASDGRLPRGDVFFSCVGEPRTVGERSFCSAPDNSVFVNCASRGEFDLEYLGRALRGECPDVEARPAQALAVPEQQTLLLRTPQHKSGVLIRKMGQNYFDGVADKDQLLVDVYMAGLCVSLIRCANRLNGPNPSPSIDSLPSDAQLLILSLVDRFYSTEVRSVRDAIRRQGPSLSPSLQRASS